MFEGEVESGHGHTRAHSSRDASASPLRSADVAAVTHERCGPYSDEAESNNPHD